MVERDVRLFLYNLRDKKVLYFNLQSDINNQLYFQKQVIKTCLSAN